MSACLKSTTVKQRVFYALPAFVLAFPTIPTFVLLPSYYGETVGLGLATVGSVFFILRLFDVISDPLIGWASDRLPTRLGKRKLPIALGGLIGAPALYFLFTPPHGATPFYLLFWGALLYLGWTAIQIPYLSWAAELEPDYHPRTRLNGWREGAGLIGILSIGALGILLDGFSETRRFELIALITIALGCLTFITLLSRVPQGRISTCKETLSFPRQNRLFLRVLSAWFINGFANGLPAVCLPLYLTHILESGETGKAYLLFIYFLFAVLGIPVWLKLSQHYGKHQVWCTSMLFACAAFIFVPFLGAGDLVAFGLICALTGLALGSDLALPPAIQADCADWDRLRFGKERLGTLFSYWSMATKLALGLAVGLAFPLLDWAGLEKATPLSKDLLIVIYAGLPIVLKLCAIGLMWDFPLNRNKHLAVQRALEKTS